jgi:hypothetical protein
MQYLTQTAAAQSTLGVFTRTELKCWIGGSDDRRNSLLKRALAAGEVIRIHRGLYGLADAYSRQKIDLLSLAQRIYGPSYISLETALSIHGWIPDAVYTVTSVSLGRSREYATPLGSFSFAHVPQKVFYTQVQHAASGQGATMLASPLKALLDYVYVHKCDWTTAQPVIQSLRVDESHLHTIRACELDDLAANYSSRRVRQFLHGLRKDLKK